MQSVRPACECVTTLRTYLLGREVGVVAVRGNLLDHCRWDVFFIEDQQAVLELRVAENLLSRIPVRRFTEQDATVCSPFAPAVSLCCQ